MSQNKPLGCFHMVGYHNSWAGLVHSQPESQWHNFSHRDMTLFLTWVEKTHRTWSFGVSQNNRPRKETEAWVSPTQESGSSWLDRLPWCQCPDTRTVENGRKEWLFTQVSQRDKTKERKYEERTLSSFLEKSWGLNCSSVTLSKTWVWTVTGS